MRPAWAPLCRPSGSALYEQGAPVAGLLLAPLHNASGVNCGQCEAEIVRSKRPLLLLSSLFHLLEKLFHVDDLDPVKVLEVSQVRISGDDVVGLGLKGTGQKLIIGRVIDNFVGLIQVFGDDRLSEDQFEEPVDGFLFGVECLLDPWILEDPADFFEDLHGSRQLKLLLDPKILELDRERLLPEDSADKEIGIDNRP